MLGHLLSRQRLRRGAADYRAGGRAEDAAVAGTHDLAALIADRASRVRAAGAVIARQRPGTAHGFVFLSLEDETGIANAIVTPDLYDRYRFELAGERFLLVEGVLQNQDNVISVKAERVEPLRMTQAETSSHDFH